MSKHPAACLLVVCASLAVAAGAQEFDPPVNVSETAAHSLTPAIVADAAGSEVRVFWHDFTSVPNLVWWAEATDSGWTTSEPCAANVTASWTPDAAIDTLGRTHLVWRDRTASVDDIFYALLDGSVWSAPVNISQTPGRSSNPTMAVDSSNNPHVLWEDDTSGVVRFYEAHYDGALWSFAADTGLVFEQAAALDTINIACDALDYLHAVWHDGPDAVTEIYYSQRPPGGSWATRELVSDSPDEYSTEPDVAVDNEGKAHVVWTEQEPFSGLTSAVFHAVRFAAGVWGAPTNISDFVGNAFRPTIAIAPSDGVPRIAWAGEVAASNIYFVAAPGDTPVNVSQTPDSDSERPVLTLDASGRAFLAWQEHLSSWEILVTREPSETVVIKATKDPSRGDVVLEWTGGVPTFTVGRSFIPDVETGWIVQVSGLDSRSWADPGVVGNGVALYYGVRGR